MTKTSKTRTHDEDYFWHAGFHIHRLVIVVATLGTLFNIFPLIYITNREHGHFDMPRVVTALLSLVAYLALFFGQTLRKKWLYWTFFTINTTLIIAWLLAAMLALYFASAMVMRLLHPDAHENQLNIWWLIYVAASMSNNPADFNRPGAGVPVAIVLIASSVLSLFGTLFQFYFLWIVIRGYIYLTHVLLNPLSEHKRVV